MMKECIAYLDGEGEWHPVPHEEVIRCKDCKYYDARDFRCETYGMTWFADDFCSNAERKDNDKT